MTARTIDIAGKVVEVRSAPSLFREKRRRLKHARLEFTGDGIEPNWYVNGVGWTVRPPSVRCDRMLTCR